MRIGMFCDMYLPHVSGVTNHISLYKAFFEREGHEVFVFTFGDAEYADAESGVVRSPGLPWGTTGWQLSTGYSREARDLIASLDIAHIHHPFQTGRFAAPLARAAGVPVVFTNHTRYDLYSDAYASFVPAQARYAFLRRALGHFVRGCDRVIAPSASIAVWLAEFADYPGALVIPNGIDVSAFARPTQSVSREELGFSASDVVFCYTGRLGAEKRLAELVAAFAAVAARAPEARLLLLGDGPERGAVENALAAAGVRNRAHLTRLVPYQLVPAYEACADAFVTASVSEAHPLVVIEALAAGLPVAAFDSPGIGDTITDGVDGLLGRSGDASELANLMAQLATDAELRARLASGASATAQGYALERTASRVLATYQELAAR